MHGLTFVRNQFAISLKELSQKIGVSPQAVNLWELNKKPIPLKRLKKLTEIFGLDEKYFVPNIPIELQIMVRIDLLFTVLPEEWRKESLEMIKRRMSGF